MHERLNRGGWEDEAEPTPLTRDEAHALRRSQPAISPWQVVLAQAGVGLVVAMLFWGWSGRAEFGWSALYGAASIAVPSAVLACGIARLPKSGPAIAAVGFMFWEGVKIVLTFAMLLLAVKMVPRLQWPALLTCMAACLSMNWVALSWRGRVKNTESSR
jgi:ATP synthase protein I